MTAYMVMYRISRGNKPDYPGEYHAKFEHIPSCQSDGRGDYEHSDTVDGIRSVIIGAPYTLITDKVAAYLTTSEVDEIRDMLKGVVSNDFQKSGKCPHHPYMKSHVANFTEADIRPLPGDEPEPDIPDVPDMPPYPTPSPPINVGSLVCWRGNITATIGAWNGVDYYLTHLSNGAPDCWTHNVTEGACDVPTPTPTPTPTPEPTPAPTPAPTPEETDFFDAETMVLLGVAAVVFMMLS